MADSGVIGTTSGVPPWADAGSDDDAGDDESGGSDDGEPEPDPPAGVECKVSSESYEAVIETMEENEAELVNISLSCDDSSIIHESDEQFLQDPADRFTVFVYRPATEGSGEPWPTEELPALFFVAGAGLTIYSEAGNAQGAERHRYNHAFSTLNEMGYVVFAIEPPETQVWNSAKRARALACAMMWATDTQNGWSEANNDRLAMTAVMAGHSRGGSGAAIATAIFEEFPLSAWTPCATVAIAPRWGAPNLSDSTDTRVVLPPEDVLPYLTMQGAVDPDTTGHALAAYDQWGPEDWLVPSDSSTKVRHDKVLTWIYGIAHRGFGGWPMSTTGSPPAGANKGEVVGPHVIASFLDWQLAASQEARSQTLLPTLVDAEVQDYPAEVADSDLWDDLEPYYSGVGETHTGNDGKPLVFASYTQGGVPGSQRFTVDTMARDTTGVTCATGSNDLSPSTIERQVTIGGGLGAAQVCHGPVADLADHFGGTSEAHRTRALSIHYGDSEPGGYIAWSLQEPGQSTPKWADAAAVTLRVGKMIGVDDQQSCEVETTQPFYLRVGLEWADALGDHVVTVPTEPIVPPQAQNVQEGAAQACAYSHFMRTVTIPMERFQAEAIDDDQLLAIEAVHTIRVEFPQSDQEHEVLVDSLELVRDSLDPEDYLLGMDTGAWKCVATNDLKATEISCDDNVNMCASSPPDHEEDVTLPFVADGPISGFDGWLAHTPRGWILDIDDPSEFELDRIEELCIKACQEEFASFDEVEIDCEQAGAFETPTLMAVGSRGPVQRISFDRLDASGVFSGESLTCSIYDDCCERFSENVCPAKVLRVSPDEAMLGRGEKQVDQLGGSGTALVIDTPGDSVAMPLVGQVGYSWCEGYASSAGVSQDCPFYIGSLELESVQSVLIEDECPDESPFEADLSSFRVELMQPAMGLANIPSWGSLEQGFPAGALHVRLEATVDEVPMTLRAVNPEDVILDLWPGFDLVDVEVEFDLPCGNDVLPVTARLTTQRTGFLESAPSGIITTASSASCPSLVDLTHSMSDADGDLDSVRWYIDGMLMAPSVTRFWMTQPVELKLVARDERGATTIRTKSVGCS